jgi:hypothetical protein
VFATSLLGLYFSAASRSPVSGVAFVRNADKSQQWIKAKTPSHINSVLLGFVSQSADWLVIAMQQHVKSYWSGFKAS